MVKLVKLTSFILCLLDPRVELLIRLSDLNVLLDLKFFIVIRQIGGSEILFSSKIGSLVRFRMEVKHMFLCVKAPVFTILAHP